MHEHILYMFPGGRPGGESFVSFLFSSATGPRASGTQNLKKWAVSFFSGSQEGALKRGHDTQSPHSRPALLSPVGSRVRSEDAMPSPAPPAQPWSQVSVAPHTQTPLRDALPSESGTCAPHCCPTEMKSGFYSPYFIVPKKGGGLRPILDLRVLNRALHKLPFGMLMQRRMLCEYRDMVLCHLSRLGLQVNWEKSKFSVQRIYFLSMELDSVNLTARLSLERAQSLLNCLESLQHKRAVPLKHFRRLLGHMASAVMVTPLGLLHMRPLQLWLHDRAMALAMVKRIGDPQAFSVDDSCLGFRPGNSHVVLRPRLGYVPKIPTTPFRDQVVNLQALPRSRQTQPLLCSVPSVPCASTWTACRASGLQTSSLSASEDSRRGRLSPNKDLPTG